MLALEAHFESRVALREALVGGAAETVLFIEGGYSVTAGTPVTIQVVAAGLAAGITLEGVVQWRRLPSQARAVALPPGVGVRIASRDAARADFLRRWAEGRVVDSGRSEPRFACDQRATLSCNSARGQRSFQVSIRDVSAHGALLTTPTLVPAGQLVRIEVARGVGVATFEARVTWSDQDRAGVRLLLERHEEEQEWVSFVASARETLRRQTIPSRPAMLAVRMS